MECPNCHDANKHGDYEGPTCEVCNGSGQVRRMADSRTTQFENALIDLIEQYVDDGLTNADIRGVLDARRDDDHEYREKKQGANK